MSDRDVFLGAYRDRSVLVTGHTGFKGSWLSAWLLGLGARVSGLALEPETGKSAFDALGLADRIDHRIGDVRDAEATARRVDETRPDVLFHMAAQALVRRSYDDPLETFATNVQGTANVLDAVRRAGRRCVVVCVTSDKCYEEHEGAREHGETDPLGGHDPYSASKGAAEIVISAYRRSFFPPEDLSRHGVALASARAGNVIGGGDYATDRIVPDIVRALSAGTAVRLRNPGAVRPWQHVLDALSGYLWLGARLMTDDAPGLAGAWNFGAERPDAVTVRELTEKILEAWGGGAWTSAADEAAPREAGYLGLRCEKARTELGFRPAFEIGDAVTATVDWYRTAQGGENMYGFTARQIESYTERARAAGLRWSGRPGARKMAGHDAGH